MAPLWPIALIQAGLAVRVLTRMASTGWGSHVHRDGVTSAPRSISIIVPVLNEFGRLAPCLERLVACGPDVGEILVVDGGSTDGTQKIVASFCAQDSRVRALDASPVPPEWNGKAWGLECGLRASSPDATWIATIDADVRPQPELPAAMVAQALRRNVPALSIATQQEIADDGSGLLHPAMLATLVYRYGLPGYAATKPQDVQANGQCFLARRTVLVETRAFFAARASICEDVSVARLLVRCGYAVGFYEADDLVVVRMHENWRETWTNWPRSLTMRDDVAPARTALGLAEVAFVQALPLIAVILLLLAGHATPQRQIFFALNVTLLVARLGVLVGTYHAYRHPPWTYWLSPLMDAPVVAALVASALRRRHTWRGRPLVVPGRAA